MATRVTAVTMREVEPEMFPDVALIVVGPAATVAAMPLESIVAMNEDDELHATDLVRF